MFPQFKVGGTYTFNYKDHHEIVVIVQTDNGEEISMNRGIFRFYFFPIREKNKFSGGGDYMQVSHSSSMVDPTCCI